MLDRSILRLNKSDISTIILLCAAVGWAVALFFIGFYLWLSIILWHAGAFLFLFLYRRYLLSIEKRRKKDA